MTAETRNPKLTKGQNLLPPWHTARRRRSRGILARTSVAYATAYDALNRNRQFQVRKRNTKVALRGLFHVACLHIMFSDGRLAMPYSRRENVRHATLFLSAPRVSTCWEIGVEGKEVYKNGKKERQ